MDYLNDRDLIQSPLTDDNIPVQAEDTAESRQIPADTPQPARWLPPLETLRQQGAISEPADVGQSPESTAAEISSSPPAESAKATAQPIVTEPPAPPPLPATSFNPPVGQGTTPPPVFRQPPPAYPQQPPYAPSSYAQSGQYPPRPSYAPPPPAGQGATPYAAPPMQAGAYPPPYGYPVPPPPMPPMGYQAPRYQSPAAQAPLMPIAPPYARPPQTAQPPIMTAAMPIMWSKPDLTRPIAVIASRKFSESDYMTAQKMIKIVPMPLIYTLLGCMLLLGLLSCLDHPYWVLALSACGVGVLIAAVLLPLFMRTKRLAYRYGYENQRQINSADGVIEVYADRLVDMTAQVRLEIRFDEIKVLLETPTFLAICNTLGQMMILSAADLTEYDARIIKQYVNSGKKKRTLMHKGLLQPKLSQPLPIPIIQVKETVDWECHEKKGLNMVYNPFSVRAMVLQLLGFLLPMGLFIGVLSMDTKASIMTPIRDMAFGALTFYVALLIIVALVFLIFFISMGKQLKARLRFAITDYGITYQVSNHCTRIPWQYLTWKQEDHCLIVGILIDEQPRPLLSLDLRKVPDARRLAELFHQHAASEDTDYPPSEA